MDTHDAPRVFEAATPPHESTIIFLHGRGDNGPNVARSLIFRPVISDQSATFGSNSSPTFRHILPHTKFVFPTALNRRMQAMQVYSGMSMTQWFDMDRLDITDWNEGTQIEGVKESTDYIHQLIRQEAEAGIPLEKIVIMGISQGCATGAIATMRYPEKLGGFVGISGWLPFITQVEDMFKGENDTLTVLKHIEKTLGSDREITQDNVTKVLKTPIFLGHGISDSTIIPQSGERLRDVLKAARFEEVVWETYDVGHWWCGEELINIASWLGMKGFSVKA